MSAGNRWQRNEAVARPDPAAVRDVLSKLPLLGGIAADPLLALAEHVEEIRLAPGAVVIREQQIPSHLYVLVDGRVEVATKGEGGAEKVVDSLGPGRILGEIGLLEGMPSTATVRTLTSCVLFRLKAARFLDFVRNTPQLHARLVQEMRERLLRTHPSYRPSASSGAGDDEIARLVERLQMLSDGARSAAIQKINASLDAAGSPDP